jgi:hypothetical protein
MNLVSAIAVPAGAFVALALFVGDEVEGSFDCCATTPQIVDTAKTTTADKIFDIRDIRKLLT